MPQAATLSPFLVRCVSESHAEPMGGYAIKKMKEREGGEGNGSSKCNEHEIKV